MHAEDCTLTIRHFYKAICEASTVRRSPNINPEACSYRPEMCKQLQVFQQSSRYDVIRREAGGQVAGIPTTFPLLRCLPGVFRIRHKHIRTTRQRNARQPNLQFRPVLSAPIQPATFKILFVHDRPLFRNVHSPRMLLQAFVDWCDEHDVDLSEALAL